jgi:2-amino-4-hydroxy-6-hydroxymethyldihydropteridine diphosphokinase
MPRQETAYLSLGSNQGRRAHNIRRALGALKNTAGVHLEGVSSCYETSPVGFKQAAYLNAALKIKTSLRPDQLLDRLKRIEKALGRKSGLRWRPRTIDLDIIFFGRRRVRSKNLVIPHAQFRFRRFVLVPLLELSPRLKDPETGKTIRQILANLTSPDQKVRLKNNG